MPAVREAQRSESLGSSPSWADLGVSMVLEDESGADAAAAALGQRAAGRGRPVRVYGHGTAAAAAAAAAAPPQSGKSTRIAPDGGRFTRREFVAYYGGGAEWEAAAATEEGGAGGAAAGSGAVVLTRADTSTTYL